MEWFSTAEELSLWQKREKRRHFIEHGCIREDKVVDGVIIAENADGAESRPQHELEHAVLLEMEFLPLPEERDCSDHKRHSIPEEAFLRRGKITCQPHECIHPGKAECRQDNEQNALVTLFLFRCYRLLNGKVCTSRALP